MITWNPAPLTYGAALSGAQLNATANVPGTFAYTPASGVLNAGTQVLSVVFTPTDGATYTTKSATANVTVNPVPLTITANNLSRVYDSSNPPLPTLTATYAGLVNGDTSSVVSGLTLATAATTASSVGSYAITVSGGTAANYAITRVNGSLTVTAQPVAFSFTGTAFVYDTLSHGPTINNPSGATYTVTSGATTATNAGSYSFTVTANGNYSGATVCNWVITRKPVSFSFSPLSFIYNGTPTVAATPQGPAITYPSGVTASMCDITGATAIVEGSYTITVLISNSASALAAGSGNFSGSNSQGWGIGCCLATVTLGNLTHTYDGTAKAPTTTTNPAGLNIRYEYTNAGGFTVVPINAGTYNVVATVDVTADSNGQRWTGDTSGTLTINQATQAALTLSGTPAQTHATTQTLTTSGGSGTGTVTYAIVGQSAAGVATLSGSSLTALTGTGWVDIQASKAGDTNYLAGAASNTFRVTFTKASQAPLLFTPASPQTFHVNQNLTTSGGSGSGAVTYSIVTASAPDAAVLVGNVLTASTGTGWVKVRASKDADNNFSSTVSSDVTVTFAKAAAVVGLSNLTPVYDGSPKSATVTTTPASLVVNVTYAGSATAPTQAGDYAVVATINDLDYAGTANGTLSIAKAVATVTLGNLAQTYDGSARPVTATTTPAGLAVNFTYGGSATAPTTANSYPVVATINDPNYQGTITGTLVVAKASATVTLGSLAQVYSGSPCSATATTSPTGLSVAYQYNSSSTPPIAAGSYSVVGTISDTNYDGQGTGTLIISPAPATIALSGLTPTYDGTAKLVVATTTPAGLPVAVTYDASATAPVNAGSYAIAATITDTNYTGSASGTLVIQRANQSALSFSPLPSSPQTMGVPQTLSAAGGSGTGSVSYAATAQSVSGSVAIAGSTLTPNFGTGWVDVQATKAGDINYYPVSSTSARINFAKAAATVRLDNLSQVYTGAGLTPSITTVPGGLTVNLTYDGSSTQPVNAASYSVVATIDDSNYSGSTTATFTIRRAPQTVAISPLSPAVVFGGSVNLSASGGQNGYTWGGAVAGSSTSVTVTPAPAGPSSVTVYSPEGGNYERSNDATVTIDVAKATPVGSFAGKTVTAPYALSSGDLNATFAHPTNAGVAAPTGAITYSPAAGEPLTPGTRTITATYPGDSNYTSASVSAVIIVNKATPTITWNPGGITYGQTFDGAQLNATASVAGTFTYNPSAGSTALAAGPQTLTVTFTPNDTTNYNSASATANITVQQADQQISLAPDPLPVIRFGDAPVNVAATASSGLPVSFSVTNPAAISGGISASSIGSVSTSRTALKFNGAGAVTLRATQAGNANYKPATMLVRDFVVQKASQAITFDNPGDRVIGYAFNLDGTATSGLPVTYTSSDSSIVSISGSTATVSGSGMVTITAHQAGDTNYDAAPDVAQTFNGAIHGWLVTPPATVNTGTNLQFKYRSGQYNGPVPYPPYTANVDPLFYYKAPGAANWQVCGGVDGPMSAGLPQYEYVVFGTLTFSVRGHYDIAVAPIGASNAPNLPSGFSPSNVLRGVDVKDTQTISFPNPDGAPADADKVTHVVNSTMQISASASSTLPVSFRVEGPGSLSGTTLTFTDEGLVTVTASQAGNTEYMPATPVSLTFRSVAAPLLVIDQITSPAQANGYITGSGWALDRNDGAPITIRLYVDNIEKAVTNNLPRSDVQAASVAAGGWSAKDVTNSGWSFSVDAGSLPGGAAGTHTVVVSAMNSRNITTTSTEQKVTGDKNAQIITVQSVGTQPVNGPVFHLVASSSSGAAVTFELLSGPATVNGDLVTPGSRGGTVYMRARAAATGAFAPAYVDFSFIIGASDDLNGNGVADTWESHFGITVNDTSDANHDGILDLEEYNLWRDPTANTSALTSEERQWDYSIGDFNGAYNETLLTNGPGTVTMQRGGASTTYNFVGASDGSWRPTNGASTTGSTEGAGLILAEGDRVITASSAVGDPNFKYIITVRPDPRYKRTRPWDILLNDKFVDGITKAEIDANGGVLSVHRQPASGLPFGAVDMSELETARSIALGIGADQAGRSAGELSFNLGSFANGATALQFSNASYNAADGGAIGLKLRAGPAALDRRMRPNQPSHAQIKAPGGYVDVQQSRWVSTVSYYSDKVSYPMTSDGYLYDFSTATPLVTYKFEIDLTQSAAGTTFPSHQTASDFQGGLKVRMTRSTGGDAKVFELQTDWFKSAGTSTPVTMSPGQTGEVHPLYYSTVCRQWAARSPSAARGSVTELVYESSRGEMVLNGQRSLQAYTYIYLTKRQYSGDSSDSTVNFYQKRSFGDDSLRSAPLSSTSGVPDSSDSHFDGGQYPIFYGDGLSGILDTSAVGGGVFTENFWNNLQTPSFGDQSWLVLGMPKQRRQTFLDASYIPSDMPAGLSSDIVTDFGYSGDLIDGKTLLTREETKQNGVKVGQKSYSYAIGSINGNDTLDTTVTSSAASGVTLVSTDRTYSRRLADRVFRGRIASTLKPDNTKVSYAYQRGDWSGTAWSASSTGRHLLIAQLEGKAGSTVTAYRGVTIDGLDMDSNKSTVTEKILDEANRVVCEAGYVYSSGPTFTLLSYVSYTYDALGNLTKKTADSGRVLYDAAYTGFRKDWEIDEQGITLTYTYDNYDRVQTMKRASASELTNDIAETTTTYTYDEIGRVSKQTLSSAGTSEQLVTSYTYDTASRPKSTTDVNGLTTSISYDSPTQTTTTLPGGGTKIVQVYADGRAKSVSGTAVPDGSTSYSFDGTTGNLETTNTVGSQSSTTEADWMGRPLTVTSPTFGNGTTPGTRLLTNAYNSLGQLTSQTTTSGGVSIAPKRLLEYDSYGRLFREGSTTGASTTISVSTDFGVKEYEAGFQTGARGYTANLYRYDRVKVYRYDGTNSSVARYGSQSYTQMSGLGSTTVSHVVTVDFDQNVTDTATTINRASKRIEVATTATGSNIAFGQVSINGLVVKSTNAQGQITLQTYDALGRAWTSNDPRIGTTDVVYEANTTKVHESTGPDNRTTGFTYDSAGHVQSQTNAASKTAYFLYDAAGNLTHQWGDTVNPVRYEYNDLGQKTKMHTYRTGDWTAAAFPIALFAADGDMTTWNYQAATGLLTSKLDANTKGPSYEYNALGQMSKRTDARGVVTTYAYTSLNLLYTVQYTDGLTTNLTYGYDRTGKKTSVSDAAGNRTFTYYDTSTDPTETSDLLNKSARQKTEVLPAFLGSHVLNYSYAYGSTVNGAQAGLSLDTGTMYSMTYGYDAVTRLNSVTYGGAAFSYTYVPSSNLIGTVSNGASAYTRDYNYRSDSNRLDTMTQQWGTDTNGKVETRLAYNTVGVRETEKTQGVTYLSAFGRSDPGIHVDYTYSDRLEVSSSGKYQLAANWTNVNGLLGGTARDYAYDPIGNRISDQNGAYVPNLLNQYTSVPGVGTLTYDLNGNLTNDGVRGFTYDAENRLVKVTQGGSTWNYTYDYVGRRIQKSGTGITTTRYLYDGWNLIAELDGAGTITRRFAWGLDVSGSLQGAGGVGGLLVIDDGSGTKRYPIYDATHNVIGLYDGSGSMVAAYEYDPFGNLQTQSAGGYAAANPFRSATKYTDSETGLVYYGMRFYSASQGRFINRDPIEEKGGLNLYGFCSNDGVNRYDLLGMTGQDDNKDEPPPIVLEKYDVPASRGKSADDISREEWTKIGMTPSNLGDGAMPNSGPGVSVVLGIYTQASRDAAGESARRQVSIAVTQAQAHQFLQVHPEMIGILFDVFANPDPEQAAQLLDLAQKLLAPGAPSNRGPQNLFFQELIGDTPLVGGLAAAVLDTAAGLTKYLGGSLIHNNDKIIEGRDQFGTGGARLARILHADMRAVREGRRGHTLATLKAYREYQAHPDWHSRSELIQTAAIPGYGNFGGKGHGLDDGHVEEDVINFVDYNAFLHDQELGHRPSANRDFIRRNLSPVPDNQLPPGPAGIFYVSVGIIPFWLKN